jgi:hypothetical protein
VEFQDALIIPTSGFSLENPYDTETIGTKVRVEVAAALIRAGTISRKAIIPFPQKYELGRKVGVYVETLPEFHTADIRCLSQTSGMWTDTLISYDMIRGRFPHKSIHVHFVSNRSEIGRLKLMWFLTAPIHWAASFHLTPEFETTKEHSISYLEIFTRGVLYRLSGK